MASNDPLLDRPPAGMPAPPSRSPTRWIVVGACALIAAVALTVWWMGRARPGPAEPAPVSGGDLSAPASRPAPDAIDLPPLNASDSLFRDIVAALSQHPVLARALAGDRLVRGATLAIVQIGDGKTPENPLAPFRPASRVERAPNGRIDPASYRRWDDDVAALTSVDPADAAQAYVNVKPLFDEAYREQGFPDGNFDLAIARAINVLAATPARDEPALVERPGYLEYADAALQGLHPVQKQFLLLGPAHRTTILGWLRAFAAQLNLQVN